MHFSVRVNNDRMTLGEASEIERLRSDVLSAVRAGGGFIRVGSGSGPELLVTPASSVRIDTLPDPEDDDVDDSGTVEVTFVDFDHY